MEIGNARIATATAITTETVVPPSSAPLQTSSDTVEMEFCRISNSHVNQFQKITLV